MIWSDKAYLLSKIKYQENSMIVNLYTENHGKCSGIIYGATSKKIKNYLQTGNELFIEFNSKNENSLGYFKTEIIEATTAKYFSDKKKLGSIISMLDLIRLLTVENQENKEIFYLIKKFFHNLNESNCFSEYIFWELEFLKLIGFNLKLKDYCISENINNKKLYFIKKNNTKLVVPNFLIEENTKNIYNKDIYNSLILIGEYMKTNIFIPNNIPFPEARLYFTNNFK